MISARSRDQYVKLLRHPLKTSLLPLISKIIEKVIHDQNQAQTFLDKNNIIYRYQSGESMVIHVINKINSRLRFFYWQNRFFNIPLGRLLCNAMTQPFFDYACNAWYPHVNKIYKTRLQAAQSKCIRFA